jgi:hypothetical protein
MAISQVEAVFTAVCEVLKQSSFDTAANPTKEQRETIITMVTEGILQGKVRFDSPEKYNTSKLVREYVVGMVSNHLRRDIRLNGGIKSEPKFKRGSRKDAQLTALQTLLATYSEGSDEYSEIQAAMEARSQELEAKATKPVINLDAIPAHLRHLVK